jgi:hypothetical protein
MEVEDKSNMMSPLHDDPFGFTEGVTKSPLLERPVTPQVLEASTDRSTADNSLRRITPEEREVLFANDRQSDHEVSISARKLESELEVSAHTRESDTSIDTCAADYGAERPEETKENRLRVQVNTSRFKAVSHPAREHVDVKGWFRFSTDREVIGEERYFLI